MFTVEPDSFRPRPKVRSAVVRLVTNSVPREDLLTKTAIFLARHAFAGRRKKVQNSLAGGLQLSTKEVGELCELAGIDPGTRPQEIPLDLWQSLGVAALDKGIVGQPAASMAGSEH
jgi:16S rRNA A1518/A1519 N6-dimethyltransferase RsmA/KsgA/DIM1 with predicted DNA glycosylase/AP lyase activity